MSKFLKYRGKYTKINKLKAITYLGGKCHDCGLQTDIYSVYEFHHLDPKQKDRDIHKIMRRSWIKIEAELKKCILLCANCHRVRHHPTLEQIDIQLSTLSDMYYI